MRAARGLGQPAAPPRDRPLRAPARAPRAAGAAAPSPSHRPGRSASGGRLRGSRAALVAAGRVVAAGGGAGRTPLPGRLTSRRRGAPRVRGAAAARNPLRGRAHGRVRARTRRGLGRGGAARPGPACAGPRLAPRCVLAGRAASPGRSRARAGGRRPACCCHGAWGPNCREAAPGQAVLVWLPRPAAFLFSVLL